MKKVILESPFAGDMKSNTEYARKCLLDSLLRWEAPFASHLLYPQVLDDTIPEERKDGMIAGFQWLKSADLVVVYQDFGISDGMFQGIELAKKLGIKIKYRFLGG